MPIDPSIALNVQMPRFANPMEVLGGVYQVRQQREAAEALAEQRRAMADQRRQQISLAEREAREADGLRTLFARQGEPIKPSEIYAIVGPEKGTKIWQGLRELQRDEVKDYGELQTVVGKTLGALSALPEAMRPEAYGTVRSTLVQKGWVNPAEVPEQYSPEFLTMAQRWAMTPKEQFEAQQPKLTNVPAGASVIDERNPQAGPVYTAPAKPPEAPSVGTFEDYVVQRFGARPSAPQIQQARKDYQQADDRPYRDPVPVVIMGPTGPQLVDRTSGTARSISDAQGQAVGLAPTAEQRNKEIAQQRAQPVLASIGELSERINTAQGVIAKISGTVERAKAQANLSDDVAEYQAVVSGFTPMLARMVGHVGVLTEQDVQSVRQMLPQPADSKSVRDRKMARIEKILGAQSAQSPRTAPADDAAKRAADLIKKYGGG